MPAIGLCTVFFQFDFGFEETVRRHSGRPLRTAFGEEELRRWFDGWQPLPFVHEQRVPAEVRTDQLVDRILAALEDPELS